MASDRHNRHRRVFEAVFPTDAHISQPTPVASPLTSFTTPGQSFGRALPFTHDRQQAPTSDVRGGRQLSPRPPSVPFTHDRQQAPVSDLRSPASFRGLPLDSIDHTSDQVHWDRSWHYVTQALTLPSISGHFDPLEALKVKLKSPDARFDEALKDILNPRSRLPWASHTEDITVWYTQNVRNHFLNEILPILLHFSDHQEPEALVLCSIAVLEAAHRQYLYGLSFIVKELDLTMPGTSQHIVHKFRRDLHAIVSNSTEPLSVFLKLVLERSVFTIFGIPLRKENVLPGVPVEGPKTDKVRREMLDLVGSMYNVGLAGERFQIIFAEIMNDAMTEYVHHAFEGVWSTDAAIGRSLGRQAQDEESEVPSTPPRTVRHTSSRCVIALCDWVENHYSRLAVEVSNKIESVKVAWSDVEKWKNMSIGRLSGLRTKELFDIVVNWPHSGAALDDLRSAITTPQRRLYLTDTLSLVLNQELLHAGTSTLEILQIYIRMISSFDVLDHSKVLLDRVSYPLQLYLCSREDTVRIIITGLLSDTEDNLGAPIKPGRDKLVELALLLNNESDQLNQKENDDELDWHDMDWVPDPVDAGPGYKRSKNADIIGTLMGALGPQDVFIKEFQNVIVENLLRSDAVFAREFKVLELFKTRFGETNLQSCEVMLKDIQDSGRVDGVVRRDQKLDPSEQEFNAARANVHRLEGNTINPEGLLKPSLHAKILSRLYWPQLQDDSFRVPDDIAALQRSYEQGFEAIKTSRKLTWLHTLGQATVDLELTDRTISEEVHTWQATVIWAFHSDQDGDTSLTRSVEELVQHLEMEEALVRSGLNFWVSKLVLHEVEKDVFAVLETLNPADRDRSNAQAAAAAEAVTDETANNEAQVQKKGITAEKTQILWKYIQSMLTNSAARMRLQDIANMLKMLVSDGFPYSNEELQEFLGEKVSEGQLELVGGKYKLVKK